MKLCQKSSPYKSDQIFQIVEFSKYSCCDLQMSCWQARLCCRGWRSSSRTSQWGRPSRGPRSAPCTTSPCWSSLSPPAGPLGHEGGQNFYKFEVDFEIICYYNTFFNAPKERSQILFFPLTLILLLLFGSKSVILFGFFKRNLKNSN